MHVWMFALVVGRPGGTDQLEFLGELACHEVDDVGYSALDFNIMIVRFFT